MQQDLLTLIDISSQLNSFSHIYSRRCNSDTDEVKIRMSSAYIRQQNYCDHYFDRQHASRLNTERKEMVREQSLGGHQSKFKKMAKIRQTI